MLVISWRDVCLPLKVLGHLTFNQFLLKRPQMYKTFYLKLEWIWKKSILTSNYTHE